MQESRSSFRARDRSYRHEMTDDDHKELSAAVHELEGMVIISGYQTPLYEQLYAGWHRAERSAQTQGNARTRDRVEVLWISPRGWWKGAAVSA
jgi:DNA adenine methylase